MFVISTSSLTNLVRAFSAYTAATIYWYIPITGLPTLTILIAMFQVMSIEADTWISASVTAAGFRFQIQGYIPTTSKRQTIATATST